MSWREVPIRSVYRRVEERGREDLPLLSVYRDHGVVPREERDDNNNRPSEDLSNYKHVRPGDLVVNKMKTWQGSLAVSNYEGIVSPAYFVGRRVAAVDDRFMHHLLRSLPLIAEYGARSKGIRPAQWDLPWDEFASIKISLPSTTTQRMIAGYLDTETARIDALIARKQRVVELLTERRQALITAAVTGEVKLCGTHEIPTMRLRRVFRLVNGGTPTADPVNWGGDVPWATPVDLAKVNGGRLSITDRTLTKRGLAEGSRTIPAGSLIVSTRAPIGYVAECVFEMAFNQGCRGLVPKVDVEIRYFRYQLSTLAAVLGSLGQGSTFVELSNDALAGVQLLVPETRAQRVIADYLDTKTSNIDALIAKQQQTIELLRESRQSLISAAVTGELDIPGVLA